MPPQTGEIRTVVERYATAWAAGDRGGIVACYHDDFTLHYFGDNVLSGVHVGKAPVLGFWRNSRGARLVAW
jgi:uncharacterized protein